MRDVGNARDSAHRSEGVPPRLATRRGATKPPMRSAGADASSGTNLEVLWIKGFDGPRTQAFLTRESGKFLIAIGIKNGVDDPRSGQQSVKVQFPTEYDAETALDRYRAQQSTGDLRLVLDKDKLARTQTTWSAVSGGRSRQHCSARSSAATSPRTGRSCVCVCVEREGRG